MIMKLYSFQVYQIHTLMNKAMSIMATQVIVLGDIHCDKGMLQSDTMTMCCQAYKMSAQKRGGSVREETRQPNR